MKNSITLRVAVMGLVLFALTIPLSMTALLVGERATRQSEVEADISRTWGDRQTVAGLVLTIPYRYDVVDDKSGSARSRVGYLVQLPDTLEVTGRVNPDVRSRGPFSAVVYDVRLELRGGFSPPDLATIAVPSYEMLWDQAVVGIGISDPRGIAASPRVTWQGQELTLVAGVVDVGLASVGVQSAPGRVVVAPDVSVAFTAVIELRGTKELRVLPVANDTTLALTSSWPHPGFIGAPLPTRRAVSAAGFEARWQAVHFARGFPASWTMATLPREQLAPIAKATAFGVSLVQPVDVYQQAERAVKYAPLFIVLTLAVAFLWEITSGRLVHPVQYLFIGFGLCLFYLLLLSLGEHLRFDVAYVSASAATIALIAWYWRWVSGAGRHGLAMGAALSALNGYLYLLLRLEDVALLAGAIGLFAMLALVMYMTRHVDWFSLRATQR